MAYDRNNVFAKMLRGEIPSHKIYEDADTLAFLDIMPRARAIPSSSPRKKRGICSRSRRRGLAKLSAVVQRLAPEIKEAVGADGVLIQQFNGAAAGQTVFHLHFHIVPVKEGRPLKPHTGATADQGELAATAETIRQKLGTG